MDDITKLICVALTDGKTNTPFTSVDVVMLSVPVKSLTVAPITESLVESVTVPLIIRPDCALTCIVTRNSMENKKYLSFMLQKNSIDVLLKNAIDRHLQNIDEGPVLSV